MLLTLAPLIVLGCVSSREQVWKQTPPRQWQWADHCKDAALLSAVVYRPESGGDQKIVAGFEERLHQDGWKRIGVCERKEQPGKGLYFEVWENRRFRPRKVVFTFRGTKFSSGLDWQANLRWFRFARTKPDRYDVARAECVGLIDQIYNADAADRPEIITTGHSLGGGIAQGIFYARARKVDHCIAFDPSPVTGYYDLSKEVRTQYENQQFRPLFPPYRVVRAYERGEILTYPRNILGAFYQPSSLTQAIEFNSEQRSGAISQHSMAMLAATILQLADRRPEVSAEIVDPALVLPASAYRPE